MSERLSKDRHATKSEHAVAVVGAGPTGLMLAGELALAGVDVAVVERRATQDLAGSRAGGCTRAPSSSSTQRGIAERFLAEGQSRRSRVRLDPLDISDFPTRHNYGLGLWQEAHRAHPARLGRRARVPIQRGRRSSDSRRTTAASTSRCPTARCVRAEYLSGAMGAAAASARPPASSFPGWEPTRAA
jgi:2-polyprenyl-6-methoxyphenol hydroxylase-like FAD-dependent oxidoreductase